ncbi:hypothetical protein B9J09_02590 [Xylella fastidiosa subsp. pauca]|uniref:hypothetical protein n=1 Tax=Xylella fastidiosa TaxID=2371 RepID=UPI000582AA5D|nr:hypothetical protein [Xylella fastidiosa]ARO68094.1 hypothetical protein B9J09_02590 [Xylella fastidiosa subsp. pauca]AVI22262.1 hypothetical protein BC375_02440 [Xylella fastidiosa]KIA59263.1 hypothetical protein RA12_02445 [Xylella fastidiosa]KXB11065.1 hypothetical protein ADT33_10465 [Xylella fastidiosa]KXB12776.1 hypothetical protein ADT32_02840 [Xylella fastidiosa]
MVNLTSLERVLNIKLKEYKEYIAAHPHSVLVMFFFLPMIISKCAILIGATNIGFVSQWEISYRTAFGGAEGYTLTMVMYWVMSPLAFLWVHSQTNYSGVSLKKAIIMLPIVWLLSIFFGCNTFQEVSVDYLTKASTYISATRFSGRKLYILGRWFFGFCMIYGNLVLICALIWYCTLSLTLRLILKRL